MEMARSAAVLPDNSWSEGETAAPSAAELTGGCGLTSRPSEARSRRDDGQL
jgi:hypothetical protein